MLVDSHCHLDYFEGPERDAVLDRARAAGVGEMVTIGTRLAQSATMRAYAEATPGVWCTVGVHPHNADEGAMAADIVALADSPKCVGIGESGLDYHYDTCATRRPGRQLPRAHPRLPNHGTPARYPRARG